MKIGRNVKHRTTTRLNPRDLALGCNHNPLSRQAPMQATQSQLNKLLADYKEPVDLSLVDSSRPSVYPSNRLTVLAHVMIIGLTWIVDLTLDG